MALTFDFYADAGLTTPIVSLVQFLQAAASPVAADKVVYFGSPTAGRVARCLADPGVDPILVSVVDANAGSGVPATAVKLALSAGGLAGATGGAALSLGVAVNGGVVNAVPIHLRVLDPTHVVAVHTDLSISTSELGEYAA